MNPPTSLDFENELKAILAEAKAKGLPFLAVRSSILHEKVGSYPGKDHLMPACCNMMRKVMKDKDVILKQPPKGNGANLEIKYYL